MGKKTIENMRQTRSQRQNNGRKPPLPAQSFIQMTTKVWQKDSHGLFDYESDDNQYVKTVHKIYPFSKKIVKKGKDAKQVEKQTKIFIGRNKDCETEIIYSTSADFEKKLNELFGVCQIIAQKVRGKIKFKIRTALKLENLSELNQNLQQRIKKEQGRINDNQQPQVQKITQRRIILDPKGSNAEVKVFNPLVCPFIATNDFQASYNSTIGYPLRPGNIIKFGRVQYVVVEMKTQKEYLSLKNQNITDIKDVTGYEGIYEVKKKQEVPNQSKSQSGYIPTCKVCLCSEEIQDDVLISPCNCKGFCGVIHIQCLKQWINSKVKKQLVGMVASYNFNRFQCEICKMPFPQTIKKQEKRLEMMNIQRPDKSYIMIESINPPRGLLMNPHMRQQQRCLHVISTEQKKSLKIGRGHACEIRISDISVSRTHAEITLNDNRFLLKNMGSKFGTLVLFDEQLTLYEKSTINIQSGRCLYSFTIQKEIPQHQNQGDTQSENDQEDVDAENLPNNGNQMKQ